MRQGSIDLRESRHGPVYVLANDLIALASGRLSLLKIQFGASESRYKQHRATSPILRNSTLIAMMQAANLREANNVSACEG
jgi:hypothetical protein